MGGALLFKIKMTYWYMKLGRQPLLLSWQMANSMYEFTAEDDMEGWTPRELVLSDMSYWNE